MPGWLPTVCYVAAYLFGGFFTLREAIDNLRLRKFEIDTLMLVAAGGAAAPGAWPEGALLLFLFSLGHALEHYAMGRAKRAIEALAELAPATATVRRDGQTVEIKVEELVVGDVAIVRPNERLPADGSNSLILDPGQFYILASKEAVQVPPDHAAEMVPFDPLVGEFRVHYAGFFDPGFGHAGSGGAGARAVLEVRSRDVPFLLEDGQIVGRLVYERMEAVPDTLYGAGAGSNYQAQGLKLSKHFV